MFKKVLVANRGEIAVRIIRALRELSISSVAVFSSVDRTSPHVLMADEAAPIGPAAASESYLCGRKLIDAARLTGAEAIHPGYGFLSENAAFAKDCEAAGICFIGPSWQSIELMGSKISARRVAIAAGAPIIPGSKQGLSPFSNPSATGEVTGKIQGLSPFSEAEKIAESIGYPILLKAAAGGGGKGMRRVDSPADLLAAWESASSEAERAFGSGEMYIEKLIEKSRHIEVQVLGDSFGNLVHLGERECSVQRRHQKVIEECPSPLTRLRPELRQQIGSAAVQIAKSANYHNAGTLEFLADQDGNFYFLEMNTRLQVEHPVTELVTGIDLVHWQLRIAAGERLTLQQEDINWRGWAMECRLYAEDPTNQFFPSPGRIKHYAEPAGPGIRVDSGARSNYEIPIEYDPLLAKICAWAETRELAIDRMRRAVSECHVSGISTNLRFFADFLRDAKFASGELDTNMLSEFMRDYRTASTENSNLPAAVSAAMLHSKGATGASSIGKTIRSDLHQEQENRAWRRASRTGLLR